VLELLKIAQKEAASLPLFDNREQGRRNPEGPAKARLTIVDKNPAAVLAALQA
jgi:DNA-binding transcriptional regulator YiaG